MWASMCPSVVPELAALLIKVRPRAVLSLLNFPSLASAIQISFARWNPRSRIFSFAACWACWSV